MGFRDPLTSIGADQITPGTLGPGVLATGFATVATGRRIDLVDADYSPAFIAGHADAPNGHYTNAMHLESYGGFSDTRAMIDLQGYYDEFGAGAAIWINAEQGQVNISGGALSIPDLDPVGVRLSGGVVVDDSLTIAGIPARGIVTGTVVLSTPTTAVKTTGLINYRPDGSSGAVPRILPFLSVSATGGVTFASALGHDAATFQLRYVATAALGADLTARWFGVFA